MLSSHHYSGYFLEPVDPVALRIPDYPLIVKEPMDIGTVRKKLKNREYKTPAQMLYDVKKIWTNSFLYNHVNTPLHKYTLEIHDYSQALQRELIDNPNEDISGQVLSLTKNKSKDSGDYVIGTNKGGSNSMSKVVLDKPMSYEEKRSLTEMIKSKLLLNSPQS
jgi:hypothetical protein